MYLPIYLFFLMCLVIFRSLSDIVSANLFVENIWGLGCYLPPEINDIFFWDTSWHKQSKITSMKCQGFRKFEAEQWFTLTHRKQTFRVPTESEGSSLALLHPTLRHALTPVPSSRPWEAIVSVAQPLGLLLWNGQVSPEHKWP